MSITALNIIKNAMDLLNINYEFGEWNSEVVYPYFVGEYQEVPNLNEDGMKESTFILNGFSRGSWLELEQAKEIIENHFDRVLGKLFTADNKSVVAIFYSDSQIIPTGDSELKRIQINLQIKEWKV